MVAVRVPITALLLSGVACGGGSGGRADELACVETLLSEHEDAAQEIAADLRTAAGRLPAKEDAQRQVADDLRSLALQLSRTGGGCV